MQTQTNLLEHAAPATESDLRNCTILTVPEYLEKRVQTITSKEETNTDRKTHDLNVGLLEVMLFLNHSIQETPSDMQQFLESIKSVFRTMEGAFGSNGWESARLGILGEVATVLALEKSGFKVFLPYYDEDSEGKIDIWASANDVKNTYLAIQLKTFGSAKELTVLNASEANKANRYQTIFKEMQNYIKRNAERYKDRSINPVVIVLSSGDNNAEALYNPGTGQPLKAYVQKLYDELLRFIPE